MITLSESAAPDRFASQYYAHFSTADGKEVLIMSGIALPHHHTDTGPWQRDDLVLDIKYPAHLKVKNNLGQDRALLAEHGTISIVPVAFYIDDEGGIAIDECSLELNRTYNWSIPLKARIATRGVVTLNRVAYNIMLVGTFRWLNPIN